ncbi:MAG: hypothetical protein EXQ94_03405 [Alphaproteobacteria bacterium]|nr:hypothetical protein [Alphaproteobacteria bacterium]
MTLSRRGAMGWATALGLSDPMAPASAAADEGAETAAPFLDARAFGLRGDGVTDDGAALQAAIDSLPTVRDQTRSGGGTILLPPGEFRIDRTLVLDHGITLRGAGHKATVLAASPGLAAPIISFDRAGQPPSADRIVIRDLFVRGDGTPGQIGILLHNVHSWLIADAWIGWCDIGVHLVATWVGEFRNARATRNASIGLMTERSDDGGSNQIVFGASIFDHNGIGMSLDGSRYCWLFGCSLESNDVGGLRVSDARNITVLAHFEGNGRYNIALSPDAAVDGAARNVVITGSTLSIASKDRRVTGIVIGRAEQVDIRGNWFFNRRTNDGFATGVELGSRARDVMVCPRSNTFQDVDRAVAVTEGEALAAATVLNGGVLPLSLFGSWSDLARFTRAAFDLDDRHMGLDVLLDADVDGPVDFGDLPAGTRVRGGPGRRTRTVRVSGDHLGPDRAVIALRREGQAVENLRVVLDGAPEGATGILLAGRGQAVCDVEIEHGAQTGVRVGSGAARGVLRDVACIGSGHAVEDPEGHAVQDNVVSER